VHSVANKAYRYGFNGKELDPEGMGGGGATYDYGFRIYNPQIAKFLSVDPLYKSYPWYTPYQFAGNKPIYAVDVDGMEELPNEAHNYLMRKGEELLKNTTIFLLKKAIFSLIPDGDGEAEKSVEQAETMKSALTINEPLTPEGAYFSVSANIEAGLQARESLVILGLGEKIDLGVSQEVASIEFVGNTEEAYLNIQVLNKPPELSAEGKVGPVGAGFTVPIKVDALSEQDIAEGEASFSVGPFKFNVPLNGDAPKMEITLLDASKTNNKNGTSQGVTISIKNVNIISKEQMIESFKANKRQMEEGNYYYKQAKERAKKNNKEKASKNSDKMEK
jgi:RHS repeat-associated protein